MERLLSTIWDLWLDGNTHSSVNRCTISDVCDFALAGMVWTRYAFSNHLSKASWTAHQHACHWEHPFLPRIWIKRAIPGFCGQIGHVTLVEGQAISCCNVEVNAVDWGIKTERTRQRLPSTGTPLFWASTLLLQLVLSSLQWVRGPPTILQHGLDFPREDRDGQTPVPWREGVLRCACLWFESTLPFFWFSKPVFYSSCE